MKFGMNLLLWTGDPDESHYGLVEDLKDMGYDGVELSMFNLDVAKWTTFGKKLTELQMGATAVTVRNAEDNPISPDTAIRQASLEANRKAVDCCAAVGATALVGPFHSALGEFSGAGPTSDEWKWGVEVMRGVAEYAGEHNVVLGVEPLNRFEIYLLNSQADATRFVRDVDHPNCRVLYDTFHAHIEEKNVAEAIRTVAPVIGHVHISENDRSTPGAGQVDWDTTFDTLKEIGYDGWLMVEAFGLALPEIAAATKIWRRMYESEKQLARDALAFMKREVGKRWG